MKNFNWGHGVVLALGCFIVFILSMVIFFPMGKDNAEMVTENYYEEELLYQNVIDAKNRADTLQIKPAYSQNKKKIKVTFPKHINNKNSTFKFELKRTNDKNLDIKKVTELDHNNSIIIPESVLKHGNYILKLSWTKDKHEYQIDYDVIWK